MEPILKYNKQFQIQKNQIVALVLQIEIQLCSLQNPWVLRTLTEASKIVQWSRQHQALSKFSNEPNENQRAKILWEKSHPYWLTYIEKQSKVNRKLRQPTIVNSSEKFD